MCKAYKCECKSYQPNGKIGDYDVCTCTHSENIHR